MTSKSACLNCSGGLPQDAAFCPSCGDPVPTRLQDGEFSHAGSSIQQEIDRLYRERLARALSGNFEIRDQIGQGGFGVVYEAYDHKLRRSLAVKVLRHEALDTGFERFVTEAQAIASLRHPGIVPVHFFGEGEGLVFMTMPLLRGMTLRERLRTGPLSSELATRIMAEVAEALQAAHDAGVIHRDLKPENIFLEHPHDRVVLMDFGIAKIAAAAQSTETGTVLGTPVYMSPEQISGGEVGPRSDLYSLGVLTWEMTTGRPPFEGPSVPQLIGQHLGVTPDSSVLDARSVPAPLKTVILRCLEKKAADRPPSPADVVRMLRPPDARLPTSVPLHGMRIPLAGAVGGAAVVALVVLWMSVAVAPALDDGSDRLEGFRLAVEVLTPVAWVAAGAAAIGLFTMMASAWLQWRTQKRSESALRSIVTAPIQLREVITGALILVLVAVVAIFIVPFVHGMMASRGVAVPWTLLVFEKTVQWLIWLVTTSVLLLVVRSSPRAQRLGNIGLRSTILGTALLMPVLLAGTLVRRDRSVEAAVLQALDAGDLVQARGLLCASHTASVLDTYCSVASVDSIASAPSTRAVVDYTRGILYEDRGNHGAAIRHFRAALAESPEYADARDALDRLLHQVADSERLGVQKLREHLLARAVAHPAAATRTDLFDTAARAYNNFETSRAAWLLFEGLDPALGPTDEEWTEAVHFYAQIEVERGDSNTALTWLRWAWRLDPGMPVETIRWGRFLPEVRVMSEATRREVLAQTGPGRRIQMRWDWRGLGVAAPALRPDTLETGRQHAGALLVDVGALPWGTSVEVGERSLQPGLAHAMAPQTIRILLRPSGDSSFMFWTEVLPDVLTIVTVGQPRQGSHR